MLDEIFHNLTNLDDFNNWFLKKTENLEMPIYASVDVRYSGWKVSVVDANSFPAGFNNISKGLVPMLSKSLNEYFKKINLEVNHVHIYPESHTRNIAYVENISRIKEIVEKAGYNVTIGSPELNRYDLLEGLTQDVELDVVVVNDEDYIEINGKIPDLVLLNNDLTGGDISGLSGIVIPRKEMGWYNRRKSDHYRILENLVDEVSEILNLDPWLLMPMWFVSEDKCLELDACISKLSNDIDKMIEKIKLKYEQYGIDSEPVVFIKNDRGTYGLGIISIKSGNEIRNLSKRMIKRLTYGKGGTSAENFLIQEGIPTTLKNEMSVIEPVGYTIGGIESNWFFRSNPKKSKFENLNSPSSVFLQIEELGEGLINSERMYWLDLVSKLSYLAMGLESIQK